MGPQMPKVNGRQVPPDSVVSGGSSQAIGHRRLWIKQAALAQRSNALPDWANNFFMVSKASARVATGASTEGRNFSIFACKASGNFSSNPPK